MASACSAGGPPDRQSVEPAGVEQTVSGPSVSPRRRVTAEIRTSDLLTPSFGVVGQSRCWYRGSDLLRCQRTLFSTGDGGRSWSNITPVWRDGSWITDAQFLTPSVGWVVGADCTLPSNSLYRTTDGGSSWKRTSIDPKGCHAGSSIAIDFVDEERGWLVNQDPVGEYARLETTADGGRTWSRVGEAFAEINFVDHENGWGSPIWPGSRLGTPLLRTQDGGESWAGQRDVHAGRYRRWDYHLPTFFTSTEGVLVVESVARNRVELEFYETHDGGSTWTRASTLRTNAKPEKGSHCREAAFSSVVTPEVWWVAAGGGPTIYVTEDRGSTWEIERARVPSCGSIDAVSSRTAWLRSGADVYGTRDGGRTWGAVWPRR